MRQKKSISFETKKFAKKTKTTIFFHLPDGFPRWNFNSCCLLMRCCLRWWIFTASCHFSWLKQNFRCQSNQNKSRTAVELNTENTSQIVIEYAKFCPSGRPFHLILRPNQLTDFGGRFRRFYFLTQSDTRNLRLQFKAKAISLRLQMSVQLPRLCFVT